MTQSNTVQSQRDAYYRDIDALNLTPLWESLHSLVPPQPKSPCLPALWRYEELRPQLMRAGELIGAREAIRRVLVLENPGLRGKSSITQALYAGLQLILPGEVAPSHRHTQAALRFVLEGTGAFTAVDGERTTMHPGDYILTPPWTWHDHGNRTEVDGGMPVVWLDGLDLPLINFLDAGFAESYPEEQQPVSRPEGDYLSRYAMNVLPVNYTPASPSSPIFNYPYARTREALDGLYRHGEPDAWDGIKVRYINPNTGGAPMATIGAFMQFLPQGFAGRRQRTTEGTIFSVVEGRGSVTVGEQTFAFGPRDHFVVPSWNEYSLRAEADAVLFSFSNRPVLEAFNLLREARV